MSESPKMLIVILISSTSVFLASKMGSFKHLGTEETNQTQVVQSCMMGIDWFSCLLVQCSIELELLSGTMQR